MKFTRKYIFIIIVLLNAFYLGAQEIDTVQTDVAIESLIENFVEEMDAEVDFTELVEDFQFYLQNPMNLNNPDYDVLKRVFKLSDYQAYQLKAYLSVTGEIQTLYELSSILGFDKQTVYRLLPFVKVEPIRNPYKINLRQVLKYGRNQLFIRTQGVVEEQLGYSEASDSLLEARPNARYLGSPYRLYTRYGFNYQNKIRFGITAEKDPGEEFFKGSQKNGFDFYSAHLFIRDFGVVKSLAIGDYHLQFGQGLTLWTGLGFGKSSDIATIKKRAQGIRPYTSANEYGFMRGAATTLRYKDFEWSLFYSKNSIDATVDSLNAEEFYIASLQETGFHRTPGELAGKNASWQQMYGFNLTYKREFSKIGLTMYESIFENDYQKKTSFYNQFDFSGIKNQCMGLDYESYYRKAGFFGEVSMSANGGWGTLNGLNMQLDPMVGISLVHRFYSVDYQNLNTIAFGEGTRSANEQGLFLGTNMIFSSKLTLDAYYDLFSFKWLRFRVDAPSNGSDYLLQLNYTPSRYTSVYVRYRAKTKALNNSSDIFLNKIYPSEKQNFRLHFSHRLLRNLSIKNRVEWTAYDNGVDETKFGFLMYQDVAYNFQKIPLNVSARYAIFDTDSYDARMFAYESDVLYAFSIPAYFYKGSRWYVLLKYQIVKNLDVWLRLSQTWYADREVISSGLDEIQGNTKTEIKAQIRLKF
ncbi:MAG: hypothetical protein RBS19_06920 [Bacteroidales bacterium]|nr:hypothetical protein [Bacteroidales bacterium]MDY0216669.1 hypothetical protein [Bacteroidales bacterium]